MELNLEWANPISLKALDGAGYTVDENKLPKGFWRLCLCSSLWE